MTLSLIQQWAEFPYLNFHPLDVLSRYRDPQLQVVENYWYSTVELEPAMSSNPYDTGEVAF